MGVTLTNTKANPGFVLYDQLNKATSLSHQSQISKIQVAYHFCFYPSLQKTRHFQRTNLNPYLPKMLQSKKLMTKISSQTEFTMSRRLSAHNKFAILSHTVLKLDIRNVGSYMRLTCENQLDILSNTKVSLAKDHGENYMKLRLFMAHHLLCNHLFSFLRISKEVPLSN